MFNYIAVLLLLFFLKKNGGAASMISDSINVNKFNQLLYGYIFVIHKVLNGCENLEIH